MSQGVQPGVPTRDALCNRARSWSHWFSHLAFRQSDVLAILDVKGRIPEWGYMEKGVYHALGGSNHHIEIKGRETTVPVYDSFPTCRRT